MGTSDFTLVRVWNEVEQVLDAFDADAYVIQLGTDGNAADPHGIFNLSSAAYVHCVQQLVQRRKPTLVLGGGGYDVPATALIWIEVLTSLLVVSSEPSTCLPSSPHSEGSSHPKEEQSQQCTNLPSGAIPADLEIWSTLLEKAQAPNDLFNPSSGTTHLRDQVRAGHSWVVPAGLKQDLNSPDHLEAIADALGRAADRIRG